MKKERKKEKREKKEKNVQWWNDHKKQFLFALFIVAIFVLSVLSFQKFGGENLTNSGGENVKNRKAMIETSKGTIEVLLYEDQAPITCANFISLAQTGFYNGLIFHRVIPGFVIQGGGYGPGFEETGKQLTPIRLEIAPGLKHLDGAIAMARMKDDPNSATSQFYICDGAQPGLDGNYAVFGIVTKGIEVVRAIASSPTHTVGEFSDVPVEDVVIISVTIIGT